MAWALQLNGEYLSLDTLISLSGDFSVTFEFRFSDVSNSSFIVGNSSNTSTWVGWFAGGITARINATSLILPNDPVDDVWYTFEISRVGSIITFSEPSLGSSFDTITGDFEFNQIGRYATSSTLRGYGDLKYITINSSHNLSADASDHSNTGSQPVLVDTIGGNNATGVNMPTGGSAWVDLGGGGAVEQEITTSITEQLAQSELINISELNAINAITCQQASNSQLSDLTLNNQLSAITTEQVTNCSLSAVANINTITAISTEQLSQGQALNNTASQLIYAVQAQQLSQALTVNITNSGAQDINVVIAEQLTQAQIISAEESQQLQSIITQQITQSLNTNIEQQLALTAITAEQLTEAVTVTVDESSGIFVSVVQTEQLNEAVSANIDVAEIVSTVIAEQLTQYSTQQVYVDLTVSAIIAEQLTQTEIINVLLQNISNQLNIDIDQISIEMLTPKYSIEMLTPTYTIEHIH